MVVGVTVAALAVTGGCSLILDFSEPGDAQPEIDAAPAVDAFDKMLCMVYEEGNSLDMPEVVATFPGEPIEAAVCNGANAVDFYQFESIGSQAVTVELMYSGGSGELNLRFHDPALGDTQVAEAQGSGGTARLQIAAGTLVAGTYVIEIYPVGLAEGAYTLTATQ